MKVLIVEDDIHINNLLKDILNNSGFITKSAYSGSECILNLEIDTFDIILLDLMIPGISGEEVLTMVREKSDIPIIVISAKDDKYTRINTLIDGADDFISKPFDIDEVIARVKTNLRRYRGSNKEEVINQIVYKDIVLDKDTMEIKINNQLLNLTSREYKILKLLIENPKKVFTKSNIFESIWEDDYLGDDNTINVHISNLRNKIYRKTENEYIQTIWGIGYKLEK